MSACARVLSLTGFTTPLLTTRMLTRTGITTSSGSSMLWPELWMWRRMVRASHLSRKAKQKYFERQYHAFLDKACELTGISLDAFVGEAKYDIGMAMYKLNEHYQDKFSLYVYFNDELKSLDEWIRETDLSGSFYFGGTLDYHY